MKRLLYIFFPVFLFGQISTRSIVFLENYQSATVLNGTSQYWTKASPASFDFGTTADILFFAIVKKQSPNGSFNERIMSKSVSPNARIGIASNVTTGYASFFISDGTTSVTLASTTNIADNSWHTVVVTADRDGNATVYVDGAVSGTPASIAAVGSVTAAGDLEIGQLGGSNRFGGLIGAFQVVRFNNGFPANIAQIVVRVSQQKSPMPSYEGGTIVAWYDWRSGGFDKSGAGNHLVPTANPLIVKVRP